MSININGVKLQTTINNTKHPQYSHTLPHNIPSQTIFNLNTMTFLGDTRTQTISNSRLAFIFLNRSIIHNQADNHPIHRCRSTIFDSFSAIEKWWWCSHNVPSTYFDPPSLLLMMQCCITKASGTYHDKVILGYSFIGTNPIRF